MGRKENELKRLTENGGQRLEGCKSKQLTDCVIHQQKKYELQSSKDRDLQPFMDAFTMFDEMIEVDVPTQSELIMTLIKHEAQQRKILKREILLFLLIACLVLITLVTLFLQTPILFVVLQLVIVCFLPFMYKLENPHEREGKLFL